MGLARGLRLVLGACCLALSVSLHAETNVIDGVTYVCEDGLCRIVSESPAAPIVALGSSTTNHVSRIAQGYMGESEFLTFLKGGETDDRFAGKSIWLVVLLVLLGGIALNLTPCVLPMIPINLMIIGRSAARGAWYGLGIMLAYGVLGILAAVGGMAFGTIQSSPWFNLAVAIVFVALALSLFGVFYIDFSKSRSKFKGGALLMGVVAAVLAGACVAPILIAVLLLTAKLFAAGNILALALPFVLGLGMALPWPFAGAGLKVLPKPGKWMPWVNRAFGVVVLGFAFWYGRLAWLGFAQANGAAEDRGESVAIAEFPTAFARAKKPVLVDCWATWCKNCAAMDRMIAASPAIQSELARFTVIRLQAEKIDELRALPGFSAIIGLPAFVIYE